jgi:hypothetical protein
MDARLPAAGDRKNAFAEKKRGMCEKKSLSVLPGNPSVCGRILCKTVVLEGYFHTH